jgi:hypothetical protein
MGTGSPELLDDRKIVVFLIAVIRSSLDGVGGPPQVATER